MRHLFTFPVILILASCNGKNQKQANTGQPSVYKIWQFKTIDNSTSHNKTTNAAWIGSNRLDLSNKDTLKFSYGSIHNKPSAYPYKIRHDTIFIQNKPGYKILKLTDNELQLLVIFKTIQAKSSKADSIVMIYVSRR